MPPSATETITTEQPTVKTAATTQDYKQIGDRRFSKEAETQGTDGYKPATVSHSALSYRSSLFTFSG